MQYFTSHTIAPNDFCCSKYFFYFCFAKWHSCFLSTSSLFHTSPTRPVVLTTSWSSSVSTAKRRIVPHNRPRPLLPTTFSILCKPITLPLQAVYSGLCYRQRPQTNKQTNLNTQQSQTITAMFPSTHFINDIKSQASPAQIIKWSVGEWRSVLGSSAPFTRP